MRVEEAVAIAQPPENVWAVVADPRNDQRCCRKVRSVDVLGERRWRVTHKPVPLRPALELQLNQLDAEPPHRLVFHQEDAAAVFNIEYRLEQTDHGTRFTQVSEFAAKSLPGVLHGSLQLGRTPGGATAAPQPEGAPRARRSARRLTPATAPSARRSASNCSGVVGHRLPISRASAPDEW
jgi:carbon monoxide dehydrogenase subunit G